MFGNRELDGGFVEAWGEKVDCISIIADSDIQCAFQWFRKIAGQAEERNRAANMLKPWLIDGNSIEAYLLELSPKLGRSALGGAVSEMEDY